MTLNLTDPAILFPGISLLFLAYTNRYLTLAGIIRSLNQKVNEPDSTNLREQIRSLHLRVQLIKYMQASAVLAFICCISSMVSLVIASEAISASFFFASLVILMVSLLMAFTEILLSGASLRMELNRKTASR